MTGQRRPGPDSVSADRVGDDRGAIAIEFAIIMSVVIVMFTVLSLFAGRVMRQEADVRSAAHAAARAASLRAEFGAAAADAESVALENLAESGVSCDPPSISVVSDPGNFIPGGTVTVRVECNAAGIGWVPSNVYWYEATEIIDEYRSES